MPRYEYTRSNNNKFVNPYNFVTTNLSNTARGDVSETKKGSLHTGVLNCKLITRTPLAIPDAENTLINSKEHKRYSFFSYDGETPVIPGSTLRGVIRSVYETASDSCFSTAKEEAIITTRSSAPFKPGVLKWNGKEWELYPAERYIFVVRDRGYKEFNNDRGQYKIVNKTELNKFKYGDKVRFEASGREYRKGKYPVGKYVKDFSNAPDCRLPLEGYLYIGEQFVRKHFESIFYLEKGARAIRSFKTDDRSILGLEETREIYNDEKVNRNLRGEFYGGYKNAKRNGIIPLWYKEDGKNIYMSLACIGRMAYQNTMGDVLKEKKPCTKRAAVCKACALFGMASNDEAIGGRVRITDACTKADKNAWNMGERTLKELAGPKISYLPFYVNATGNKWSYDEAGTSIRGRKFYWHNDNKNAYFTNEKTERNSTMQLVNPGIEFEFQVYFNDITDEELNELEWVITLGENKTDSSLCHKVGHGKPIGLGSSKIVIESCVERSTEDGAYEIIEASLPEKWDKAPFEGRAVEELLIITDMNSTKGKNVRYPYINNPDRLPFKENDNNVASHKWFGKNYKLGASTTDQTWVDIKGVKSNRSLLAYDIHEQNRW